MSRQASWALMACAVLAAPSWAESEDARAAARRIDKRLEAAWAAAGVTPAAAADDAEFLRRAYLDLAGRIPTVAEVREFLADRRADRRARLIDRLLASPRFVTNFTRVYRNLLVPEAANNIQVRIGVGGFERWLEDWLASDKGYDVLVTDLLNAPVAPGGRAFALAGRTAASPGLFYTAKELKPEEIAAEVSRTFLGVNIGCAQCHHHPFASWKREQFWSFAAFFSGIEGQRMGEFRAARMLSPDTHEITIPGTTKVMKATFLDGKPAAIARGGNTRRTLAEWVTSKDNPYFAKAAVNRTWAHLFGTGLLEPLDEMAGGDKVASHPEILDELSKGFIASGYDMRWLIKAITATRAYQLSSARTHASQDDPAMFARAAVRGLSPEQLYDSLVTATGHRDTEDRNIRAFIANGPREQFLSKFASAGERPVDVQASILQALTLMNGRMTTAATRAESSQLLQAISDAPYLDMTGKIETLYLATLSRRPTAKETERLLGYVANASDSSKGDPGRRRGDALGDVFWVLLNSAEFYFNH